MAAQLTCDPIIKIILTSGDRFDDIAPDFVCESFALNKGLLRPNKFDFTLRRDSLTIETSDIEFELREKLLTAKVEVSLKAKYYDSEEQIWQEYEVEDFFYGYIQNIKVSRSNGEPLRFKCVAYSPDARMKHHPACKSFKEYDLKSCVENVLASDAIEPMVRFDRKKGKYSETGEPLKADVKPLSGDRVMPYTVQYNESHYNFLKRLARRYGEFMYYENREFVFGQMKELPEVLLHNGSDLEGYTYELNMNDHDGIVFSELDTIAQKLFSTGFGKHNNMNEDLPLYDGLNLDDYDNDMATSAFTRASDYFSDYRNSVYQVRSLGLIDKVVSDEDHFTVHDRRDYLERYVLSDSLICTGRAAHVDLKLGTVITIEDETNTGAKDEENQDHRPLKVIELVYCWNKRNNLCVFNQFKAIPLNSSIPPYLMRDKDGFLVYGDFDAFPKSGPQFGHVVDTEDPEHLGRVKVALIWQMATGYSDIGKSFDPEIEDSYVTPWIRVMSPYQGFHRGSLVVPEVGEQVMVGFEHNNAERPFVIGSLFKQDDMPAEWSRYEKNRAKGFRTRSGHCIEFIDGKETASDKSKGGRIHIYDAKTHFYDILLDTDQKLIKLTSKGNIEMYADNDIIMNAEHNIVFTAKNDYSLHVENNASSFVSNNITEWTGNDRQMRIGNNYTHITSNDINFESMMDMRVRSNRNMVVVTKEQTNLLFDGDLVGNVCGDTTLYNNKEFKFHVEGEGTMTANKKLFLDAEEYVVNVDKDISEYSNNHNIKALKSVKLNATTTIDLKAPKINEN